MDVDARLLQRDGEPPGPDAHLEDGPSRGQPADGVDGAVDVGHAGVPVVIDVGEGVPIIAATHPADGAKNIATDITITADLNAGHPVDADSLSPKSVRLVKSKIVTVEH